MNTGLLEETAKALVAPGKGILAADTSIASTQKRFDAVGIENTRETRRDYREILITTPGIEEFLTGVILFDETFWDSMQSGQIFREYLRNHNILPGIKVDKGLVDLPGFANEKVTQGLDGLPEQMVDYAAAGARFAKWRAVITIGDGIPTDECIGANTLSLARYARICQDQGVVPIVEPEILFDGNHSIERSEEALAHTLDILFNTMRAFRVHLPGAILKTSMVLPGKDSGVAIDHEDTAERTVRVLYDHAPHELGGIVFLSGGQSSSDALIDLDRIVDAIARRGPHPWNVTFSYDRALQDPALKAWAKNRQDIQKVQDIFYHQLKLAAAAARGELEQYEVADDTFVSRSQD